MHQYNTRHAKPKSPQSTQESSEGQIDNQSTTTEPANPSNTMTEATDSNPTPKLLNRKIDLLKTLKPEDVKEFQHAFKYCTAAGSRKVMMKKEVLDAIEHDVFTTNKTKDNPR